MKRQDWPPIAIATAIFASLSLWMAAASPGFLEADACTHYQYARFALGETHYLVNVWGRPFVTALYAIPATLFGRLGVRATSLVCALLIATIAWRIARDQKYRWPALAFVFTLAQPLVFLHSFSELTELPFALLLAMAFWAYVRREWLVMAIFVALGPTARPEGFGFLILAAVALIVDRRWWWIALLPVPMLIWTYAGWRIYGRPVYPGVSPHLCWLYWLKHEWPYSQTSTYAAGPLLHFVALLPAMVSPLLFPFVMLGTWKSALPLLGTPGRGQGRGAYNSHQEKADPSPQPSPRSTGEREQRHARLCQRLIAAIPLMILAGHSLLYWRARMASNGELRYLLIVAPFWGLLAATGWEWTFERFHWRHPFLWAGLAALLPILVNFTYPVLPLYRTVDGEKARAVADWYKHDRRVSTDYPRVLASNPEVAYYLGVSHTDAGWVRDWRKETVAQAPPGTLLVWDPVYGQFNADADRVITLQEIERAGWVERPNLAAPINEIGDGPEWRVFLSPISIFGKKPG